MKPILDALDPLLAPLEAELAKLQPRERAIVAVGAVFVAFALVWFLICRPVFRAHARAEQELAAARSVATQLERAAALVPRSNAPAVASGGSLLSTVDESSKAAALGKTLTRLSPDGDSQVHAWLEGVSFDTLVRWMYALQSRYGLRIDSVDIEQQPTPGVVNGRITVVKGS